MGDYVHTEVSSRKNHGISVTSDHGFMQTVADAKPIQSNDRLRGHRCSHLSAYAAVTCGKGQMSDPGLLCLHPGSLIHP